MRDLYGQIGNGGFGPAYGLLGLTGGMLQDKDRDALGQYEAYRELDPEDPDWSWPEGLLPLVHLGCAMYFCVDCKTPTGDAVWFEPNVHGEEGPWTDSLFPLRMSFSELMLAWAGGASVLSLMESAGPTS